MIAARPNRPLALCYADRPRERPLLITREVTFSTRIRQRGRYETYTLISLPPIIICHSFIDNKTDY
jgi:hypothetical protein